MKPLLLAMLGAGLLLTPSALRAEPVQVPAFTAFSEPDPRGIDVRESDGVYGWSAPAQSVVWYGDLRDAGQLQAAVSLQLPPGQKARWRLNIDGQNPSSAQNQRFALEGAATGTGNAQTVNFGAVERNGKATEFTENAQRDTEKNEEIKT